MLKENTLMNRKFEIKALVCMLVLISVLIMMNHKAEAASFTWTAGSEQTQALFDHTDSQPGIAKIGTDVWVVYADPSPGITNPWQVYKGTTIDNVTLQYTGTRNNFPTDRTDYRFWNTGLWVDSTDGKWYTLVHTEYAYGGAGDWPMRRVGLATSSDMGENWTWGGWILTSDSDDLDREAGAGSVYNRGIGDPRMFVDSTNGYIYAYYFHHWLDQITGEWLSDTRVARSPIASKMAVGSWKKFYNGAWNEDGVGGHDSIVFKGSINMFVFYSTYLNKFVALGNAQGRAIGGGSDYGPAILTSTDLNNQVWTPTEHFIPNYTGYYNWVWDTASASMYNIGQSFRFYASQAYVNSWAARYIPITMNTGSTTANLFKAFSYVKPVPDYDNFYSWLTPGAYRRDFNDGSMIGWSKIYGNGSWTVSNKTLLASSDANNTMYVDNNSSSIANGYMSFSVKPDSSQFFKAFFRYQAWNNYAGIYYTNGSVGWENGGAGWGTLFNISNLDPTKYHRFEIYYSGNFITIYVNYELKWSGYLGSIPTAAGKVGFIVGNNTSTYMDDLVETSVTPVPPDYTSLWVNGYWNPFTVIGGFAERAGSGGTWSIVSGQLKGIAGAAGTYAVDNTSPKIRDGEVAVEVSVLSGQKLGVVTRFTSPTSYNMIFIDGGTLGWETATDWGILATGITTPSNLQISYSGTYVIVRVNGITKYSGTINGFNGDAGYVGLYVAANTQVIFDNLSNRFGNIEDFSVVPTRYHIDSGNGAWTIQNGQLQGTANDSNDTTILDENSLTLADSFLSYRITPVSGQKFGARFRVTPTQYGGVNYDNGNWSYEWKSGASAGSGALFTQAISTNTTYDVKIYYTGTSLTVWLDGVQKFSGTIASLPTPAGKIGFKVFNLATAKFDDVVNN
jgi:hypothetical protein